MSALDELLDWYEQEAPTTIDKSAASLRDRAKAELAALREKCERLEAVAYNIQNGPNYFHDGDDPCWILDSECETVCHVPTPEKGRKLMAVLNAHDELIQEVVRLRYQLEEAQKR